MAQLAVHKCAEMGPGSGAIIPNQQIPFFHGNRREKQNHLDKAQKWRLQFCFSEFTQANLRYVRRWYIYIIFLRGLIYILYLFSF